MNSSSKNRTEWNQVVCLEYAQNESIEYAKFVGLFVQILDPQINHM